MEQMNLFEALAKTLKPVKSFHGNTICSMCKNETPTTNGDETDCAVAADWGGANDPSISEEYAKLRSNGIINHCKEFQSSYNFKKQLQQ